MKINEFWKIKRNIILKIFKFIFSKLLNMLNKIKTVAVNNIAVFLVLKLKLLLNKIIP